MLTAIDQSVEMSTLSTSASLPIQMRINKSTSGQPVRLKKSMTSASHTSAEDRRRRALVGSDKSETKNVMAHISLDVRAGSMGLPRLKTHQLSAELQHFYQPLRSCRRRVGDEESIECQRARSSQNQGNKCREIQKRRLVSGLSEVSAG